MNRGSQADRQGQPRPGNRIPGQPPRAPERLGTSRFVLLAVLFVVIVAGLGGAVVAPGWNGRFHHDGPAIGGVLEALLAILLAVLLIRGRRMDPTAFVAARLRTVLSYVVMAAMVVIPLVLLSNVHFGITPRPRRTAAPPQSAPAQQPTLKLTHPVRSFSLPVADVLYGLLAAVVLAVLICAVRLWRRQTWRARRPLIGEFDDEPEELRGAVESGRAALRLVDDTRGAIIACYVAMEQSLASEGTARAIADTPDELLAKAAAAGLVRSGAAARLTALFYEARFSSHPMGRSQRDSAEHSLGELAADLRDKRPATAAANPPGSQP